MRTISSSRLNYFSGQPLALLSFIVLPPSYYSRRMVIEIFTGPEQYAASSLFQRRLQVLNDERLYCAQSSKTTSDPSSVPPSFHRTFLQTHTEHHPLLYRLSHSTTSQITERKPTHTHTKNVLFCEAFLHLSPPLQSSFFPILGHNLQINSKAWHKRHLPFHLQAYSKSRHCRLLRATAVRIFTIISSCEQPNSTSEPVFQSHFSTLDP